jgi:molecular chaperone GrpE (heat shock protein)
MDFEKELKKFNFMEMDQSFISRQNEMSILFEGFNSSLKRIGKEQNKTNVQLEDIRDFIEETKEKQAIIVELKKALAKGEEDKTDIIKGILAICDHFEDIYRYAIKYDVGKWAEQLSISWSTINDTIVGCGLERIDEQYICYNPTRHQAIQTSYNEDYQEGYVLEIIRCGYIHNGVILRKAQENALKLMEESIHLLKFLVIL